MAATEDSAGWLAEMHSRPRGVLTTAAAAQWVGHATVRWRLESGRWQRPCRGVVVTHSGPLGSDQWHGWWFSPPASRLRCLA